METCSEGVDLGNGFAGGLCWYCWTRKFAAEIEVVSGISDVGEQGIDFGTVVVGRAI